jgi:hypothetical protein
MRVRGAVPPPIMQLGFPTPSATGGIEHARWMKQCAPILITLLLLMLGCSTQASSPPGRSASSSPGPRCPQRLPGSEIRGQTAGEVELWALLFSDYPLPRAEEVKIVWRMTGGGDLMLEAAGPNGQQLLPIWGPEAHTGSNWNRPGAEWGSGFNFPQSGCWTIRATRGGNTASVGLLVDS